MAKFHKSAYWGNWSRVFAIQQAQKWESVEYIEVDLTPIPSCYGSKWSDVAKINIRCHNTPREKKDVETELLPYEVLKAMEMNLGKELTNRLLTEDFLPQIDWELYKKFNNGGASFERIKKQ